MSAVLQHRLFGRWARLKVGPIEIESSQRIARAASGRRTRGLRVRFAVTRSLEREANTARVEVYNLSPDTRDRLARTQAAFLAANAGKKMPIELEAGYEADPGAAGASAGLLFRGQVERITTERSAPDVVTLLETADGLSAMRTHVAQAFRPGVSVKAVVEALIGYMGVQAGQAVAAAQAKGLAAGLQTLANGFTAHGPADALMERLARSMGLDFSVQNGEAVLLAPGEALGSRALAVALTPATGLLDSPRRIHDPERPRAVIIEARALLNAQIQPGGLVTITSEEVDGTFKVLRVDHEGDTDGAEWFSTLEAIAV